MHRRNGDANSGEADPSDGAPDALAHARLAIESDAPEKSRGKRGRLLVVDDEELILKSVTRVLRRIGYDIVGHTDPIAALANFEAEPSEFDAVITDFRMPQMTGLQLAERVVAARPGLPILLVSGYTGEIDRERARNIGINQVVSKPFSTLDFAEWLEQVIASDSGGVDA